jgi:glycosyltransferase involved in cell wall biosynthesis
MPDVTADRGRLVSITNVTPLILTFNERENIQRVLDGLQWAPRIVVVDSGSTDGTLDILEQNPAVDVVVREFDDHASQWNFAVDQASSDWVLALDADYVATADFALEVAGAIDDPAIDGYVATFRYCIDGRPLRRSLYPPKVVLFRRGCARYARDGHTQRLQLAGQTSRLRAPLYHDDRKPLRRWLEAQDRYARLEAAKLAGAEPTRLSVADRVRRAKILAPALAFMHCLVVKGLILDGRDGIYYALQRLYAETLLSLYLADGDGNI